MIRTRPRSARRTLTLLATGALLGAAPLPPPNTPVLDRAVAKGQLLSAADFVDGPPTPGLARGLQIAEAAGMETVRNLAAGSIVRGTDVVPPQLVRRGEAVTITLRSDRLVIATAGRALASGAAGEPVRVVALATNRTLDAVVEGRAMVRLAVQ